MLMSKKMVTEKSKKINFFPENNKGLSGIVTALILIVLVLVAAGIVWAVYNSLIKGSGEDAEFNQKCLGIIVDAQLDTCTEIASGKFSCSVILERSSGSSGQAISGVELVFDDGSQSSDPQDSIGNIGAKKLVTINELPINATNVDIRVYLLKEDGETKHFCSS